MACYVLVEILINVFQFSGRFHGKLQSRSFPELSDAVKEKPPVRQLSENQSKLPVASTK